MILKELIAEYLIKCEVQNNLDSKTLKAYRIDLSQFEEYMGNEEDYYSKEKVGGYICILKEKGYAVKTIKRKIASLKAFFSYLSDEDIIELNPFYKMKIKMKEPFVLPRIIPQNILSLLFKYIYEEIDKCSISSYKYKELIRDRAILILLSGTGMRISEACTLKIKNIDYSSNIIKIYGKGAKERIIPIYYSELLEALKKYEKVFYEDITESEYFFINKRKNPLSSQSVRNMIKKHCEGAGINLHITPHMFRHTFATMLLDEDVDSRYIQMILGHSNIMTTQIYTHVTSKKKNEIMKYKNPLSKIFTNKG